MKYFKFLFTLVLMTTSILLSESELSAQDGPYMEKIKAQRVAFFTEKLDLSAEEAQTFWPVYNDFTNRKQKINAEMKNLRVFLTRNSENLKDPELEESLEKYVNLKSDDYQLFIDYNTKFIDILGTRKVMRLYMAEEQFKQFLLRQIRNRPDSNPRNRRN